MGTTADDTHVTMCVAECMVANGFLDPEDLARRFVAWLPTGRGNGQAATAAVERLRDGEPWYRVATSSGNGTARRAAPIGLARWNNPARQRAEAILSTLPTPCEPLGVAGAVAMAAATAFVVARQPGEWTAEEFITAIQGPIAGLEPGPVPERRDPTTLSTLHDRIGELPCLLSRSPAEVFARLSNGAHVPESVPAALYCFLRSTDDVEEMLLLAVNAGYNAGSVAAMAGTLAGAVGGMEALPAHLLHALEYREHLTELAGALYRLAMAGHGVRTSWNGESAMPMTTSPVSLMRWRLFNHFLRQEQGCAEDSVHGKACGDLFHQFLFCLQCGVDEFKGLMSGRSGKSHAVGEDVVEALCDRL